MSEQMPASPAKVSPAEPASSGLPELNFDRLLGNGVPNTDQSPTIISKTPPTQNFIQFGTVESSLNGNVRGRTLAHFELLEPIGVGGMAAVLRARDKLLDRFVALKILPPEMAVDPEHVQRFHQEARAAAKLDHENVARVYYCGEDQKLHFIAFEFVEGQNLRTVLERQGRLRVKEAVHYLLQIATGLAHAASRGVVHRDIKPSNIIIMPNGRAKLVDMGLARSLSPHDNRQLTQSGVTLGTFDYISPEQALEPRDADVRSDIYSLGCTFYHMLAGQPPVPEGTAARKLHHHQYVAPIDPRQINPEIPDEVAAILQRMMAKDAKDRYQRAEHLVHHLLQMAQKLGGVEVPEGAFFVDAPLPSPPRKRPLVLAGIAAAALGTFVLAVAVTPRRAPTIPLPRSKALAAMPGKDDPTNKASAPVGIKEPAAGEFVRKEVSNEKEFSDALAEERAGKVVVVLKQDLRLSETGLTYHGGAKRSLVVESEDANKPATIQFAYTPDAENPTPFWAGLTVESGTVLFRKVHFAVESGHTPRQLVAGVAVTAGQVVFDHCSFSQQTPEEELIARRNAIPIASVATWNLTLERPPLVFRNCYFAGGQAAVSIKGSARVEQSDCAFGPHACLFHLWGQEKDEKAEKAELFLSHISAQVAQGPVFRLDDVNCVLGVQYSIFSCPSNASSLDRPDLIRQTGAARRTVKFEGKRNAYHQLMSYWAAPSDAKDDPEGLGWSDFKTRIALAGGSETGSSILKVSPWARPSSGIDDDPKTAFQVDPKLPELRVVAWSPDHATTGLNRPIGVEICAWGPLYPTPLPPLDSPRRAESTVRLAPKERLVDPSGTIVGERVHKKLEAAISEAEPDDVILIKHNGELKVEPTTLTENRRVKLRPYLDYQPVLVLGPLTLSRDAERSALFHLHHSRLEFEHLEIVLRPTDGSHRKLAVATMGGDSACWFDQCVITLDGADNSGGDLDAVTLLDTHAATKANAAEPKSRGEVKFKSCFVRGRGDLVGVQASRALDLDLDSCLVCLAGSLLTVRSPGSDAIGANARTVMRLNKTTAYLAEPALHLISGKLGQGLGLTQVTATGCLFASVAAKPLVKLEGPENENQLKRALGWSGPTNAFVGFDKLLEQSAGDAGMSLTFHSDDWKRFIDAGTDTRFDAAALQLNGGTDRDFAQIQPGQFGPRSEVLANFGVLIEQLPRLSADTGWQHHFK